MEDAQVALAVKEKLIRTRLSVDDARKAYHPSSGLADAGRHAHLVGVTRLVLRNGLGGTFVIIQHVLRKSAQRVNAQVVLMEEAGQKLRIAAPIRKMRKSEMTPGIDSPIAVAVVDHFHRRAVEISEILVKVGGTSQRLECDGVFGVLPVQRDLRHREMVVACRRA